MLPYLREGSLQVLFSLGSWAEETILDYLGWTPNAIMRVLIKEARETLEGTHRRQGEHKARGWGDAATSTRMPRNASGHKSWKRQDQVLLQSLQGEHGTPALISEFWSLQPGENTLLFLSLPSFLPISFNFVIVTHAAYGDSQARSASLRNSHSHSHTRAKPPLQTASACSNTGSFNPPSEPRD